VRAAVETSRPLIEAGGHEFTVAVPPEPIHLDADLARLAQVISNLLNNAAKYTHPGGRIWLGAERQGSDAVLAVRDTGIGIPADMLPRIFEMFTQVNRPLDRSHCGLGIGLALVKRLVEMHGGVITAHSDGPGKGSEFTVRLPAVMASPHVLHLENGRSEPALATSPLRILVVDDNEDSAVSVGMLLRIIGNDVRTGHDGLDAVALAQEFRPHVILLDIGLPEMSGHEVARAIRQEPWGRGMVLIAVTGWSAREDRERSRVVGFDHHLVKPVEPGALVQLLASLEQSLLTRG
jgi:CheY-like chemotaxis protein